jgi:hypothetical protein
MAGLAIIVCIMALLTLGVLQPGVRPLDSVGAAALALVGAVLLFFAIAPERVRVKIETAD